MNKVLLPQGPGATRSARQHASCPPLAILRPKGRGSPSDQRMSYRSCYEFHRSAARAIDAAKVAPFLGDARAALARVDSRVGTDAPPRVAVVYAAAQRSLGQLDQ